MDSNRLIDNENKEAIESNIVQFIHQMNFGKDLFENWVEYSNAYEKIVHLVKYADVIIVEYLGKKTEIYLDGPIFRSIM